MGAAASEPCLYDKLSESIEVFRRSGGRYGMSERDIQRFIQQVLETNEPRRDPQQVPVLRAALEFLVAVGFVLLVVLAFTYPQSHPQLGLASLGGHNWSSPLSHVRLLSLPIAKKYNLHGFHEWWSAGTLRRSLVNCSACSDISSVLEVREALKETLALLRGPQLVLLKGGSSLCLQRKQLKELYSAHSDSMSILLEEDDFHSTTSQGFPQGPASLPLLSQYHQPGLPPGAGQPHPALVCCLHQPGLPPGAGQPPPALVCCLHQPGLPPGAGQPPPALAVQLCDQGEGSALVVSQGRALPPAGQCGHYSAALPCHPQYNISEQGKESAGLACHGRGTALGAPAPCPVGNTVAPSTCGWNLGTSCMLIPVTGKWSSFQGEAKTLSVTVQLFNVKVKGSDLPAI